MPATVFVYSAPQDPTLIPLGVSGFFSYPLSPSFTLYIVPSRAWDLISPLQGSRPALTLSIKA